LRFRKRAKTRKDRSASPADRLPNPYQAFEVVKLRLHLGNSFELDRAGALQVLDYLAALVEDLMDGIDLRTGDRPG
jgi:hypothetical protein